MADTVEFLVVPLVALGAGETYDSAQAALDAAASKTSRDRTPRAVVQVAARIKPDPRVALMVTRNDTGKVAREVAP